MTNISTRLELWEERDRLHIALVDAATEQITICEWWDDDARDMIEMGYIKTGLNMQQSLIDYAEALGVMPQEPEDDEDTICITCGEYLVDCMCDGPTCPRCTAYLDECTCITTTIDPHAVEMMSWYENNGR